jgi:hypothetical protein
MAEDAARELPNLSLGALQLVHLYAERGSPKFERAALLWLERYLVESTPRLQHFADLTASLAELEPDEASARAVVRTEKTGENPGGTRKAPQEPLTRYRRSGKKFCALITACMRQQGEGKK